ncbi:hypothetical protein [Bradyrhizobium sp. DOA1]|uniref:hypothetical protein n=1 Tax=Bradyrhizobium sp. DOA1 TaxID=1126616 RepID=UPI00077C3694|nr:hypothetical protein [Bradyrhizobium sp. DOA1]KYH01489.1 hypothetical protein SE91_25830 [Bradyrhizobium sp. DOA1]
MQISIVAVIDIVTALKEGTLDGNAYLIDNTGPCAPQAGSRVTNVPGVYNADGSQATEAVLNWITVGVADLPLTLPRSYRHRYNEANTEHRLVDALRKATRDGRAKLLSDPEAVSMPKPLLVRRNGAVRPYDAPLLNGAGEVLEPDDPAAEASAPPVVTHIRGPAVEHGILYPALYGSPDLLADGWYWSATVNTAKVGCHEYQMDVTLYQQVQENGESVWEPRPFSLTCSIQVGTAPGINGFTGGFFPGLLPILPSCLTSAAGEAI